MANLTGLLIPWFISVGIGLPLCLVLASFWNTPRDIQDLRTMLKWSVLWPVMVPFLMVKGVRNLVKGFGP